MQLLIKSLTLTLLLLFCGACFKAQAWQQLQPSGLITANPVQNPNIGLDSTLAYVFEHARLDLVPSGYLQDFAVGFENLGLYNGAKNSPNLLYPDTWRRLYATLMTGACNANALALPDISAINKMLRNKARTDTVPVLGFDWIYHQMDSLAVQNNNASVINDQIHIASNRVNQVFQEQRLFAVCQGLGSVSGPSVVFKFDAAHWLSNTGQNVTGLEVDFGNGQGFVPVSMGSSHRVYYSSKGLKTLTWRIPAAVVLPNGSLQMYRYSYSQLMVIQGGGSQTAVTYDEAPDEVLNFPMAGGGLLPVKPYKGRVAQATVSISYGEGNNTGFLQKPLIVLEGFDVWHITNPEEPEQDYQLSDYLKGQLATSLLSPFDSVIATQFRLEGYDLVFVNWARGATYIQEHAYLVAQILQWVNQNKAFGGSTEPNVLLGYSMGGLVGRYVLAAMEQDNYYIQNNIHHDVRLFASIDAPHQGAVVPLGAMAMVQHLGASTFKTAWPFKRNRPFTDLSPDLRAGYISYNSLAAKQMLRYRVVGNNNNGLRIDSTAHTQFMQELRGLGYPQQSRNIALSNGSQCGRGQDLGFDQNLLTLNGPLKSTLAADALLLYYKRYYYPKAANFMLALYSFTGKNNSQSLPEFVANFAPIGFWANQFSTYELDLDFRINSMDSPGTNNQVYLGKIVLVKKWFLGLIKIRKTYAEQSLNAPANMLRWEQAPGGAVTDDFIDINNELLTYKDLPKEVVRIVAEQFVSVPNHNFVPTVSALDLGQGQATYTEADLYRDYGPQNPPPLSLASPFDAIFTASRENESHILSTALNATWLFTQINQNPFTENCQTWCNSEPEIITNDILCQGDTLVATVLGVESSTVVRWPFNEALRAVSDSITGNPYRFVVNTANADVLLQVELLGDCGNNVVEKLVKVEPTTVRPLRLGSGPVGTTNGQLVYCQGDKVTLAVTSPIIEKGLTTEWIIPCGTIESSNTSSVKVRWQNSPCNQPLQVRTVNLCGQKSEWLTVPVTLNTPPSCSPDQGPADAIAISTFRSLEQQAIKIVPNPSGKGQALQIALNPTIDLRHLQNARLRIYNAQGYRVLQRPWPKGKRQVRYKANSLPTGIYTVQLVYSQGTISTRWVKE